MSNVSNNVRAILARGNFKKGPVADYLKIAHGSLSRKLHNKCPFTLDEIIDLHELTGASYDELLTGEERH